VLQKEIVQRSPEVQRVEEQSKGTARLVETVEFSTS
jgi:hypothetical protein